MVHLLHRLYGVDAPVSRATDSTVDSRAYCYSDEISAFSRVTNVAFKELSLTWLIHTYAMNLLKGELIVQSKLLLLLLLLVRLLLLLLLLLVRGVLRMNEVNARRARSVHGWITVFWRV